jgi:capsular polysaccharide export protein
LKQSFLFLQGVATPFFSRLADALAADGHGVQRINFCAGDAMYWRGKPARRFNGTLEELPAYLEDICRRERITDIVLFGERRPVHRPAIELAQRESLRVHAFDEGYIRPNWLTLERRGAGAAALPRDAAWYLEANGALPQAGEGRRVRPSLFARAMHDMAYHAANVANPFAFPRYRTHRPYVCAVEYAGWANRYARFPWRKRRDQRAIRALIESSLPFYLLPLQLNADAQIKHRSPFSGMPEVIEQVLRSFAARAAGGARLLIKNHPLDTGLVNYPRLIRRLARALDIAGRVEYVETGDLAAILQHARGVVTVNSSMGFSAIQHRRSTKTLGTAIYDLPRLTCQCVLDDFWRERTAPDLALAQAFRNVVIHATQVNGDFYTARGIELAVAGRAPMLEPRSRLQQLLERVPASR